MLDMESKKGYTVVLMALQSLDPSEKKPHIYAASQYYIDIFFYQIIQKLSVQTIFL